MKLFDYQEQGVAFVREHGRAYIAFDMGMGKTLTSIAAMHRLGNKNTLLIAEKNEIVNSQNFKKEVHGHFPDLEYVSLRDVDIDHLPDGRLVCGINPDGLAKISVAKVRELFDAVIVDEATLAKNTATLRFKHMRRICDAMDYMALLSGTPMMNGASEIFAPLVLMNHWLGGDGGKASREAFETIFAGGFRKRVAYTGIFWKDWRWWAKGANHVRVLRWITQDAFLIKQKKESDAFKPKERKVEYVHMDAAWEAEYEQAWDDYIAKVKEHNKKVDPEKLKNLENIKELQAVIENGQVYQVNSRHKAKRVAEDIAAGKYGDRRIVAFSLYIETDKVLQEELARLGVSFRPFEDIAEWKKGDEKVIVGRIKSHAKGANLPEASAAVFVDMDYVPANNLQAENRIDRPEQTRDMIVAYYLTEQKTVDQHVQKAVRDKVRKIDEFMRPINEEEKVELPKKTAELLEKYGKEFRLLRRAHEVTNS